MSGAMKSCLMGLFLVFFAMPFSFNGLSADQIGVGDEYMSRERYRDRERIDHELTSVRFSINLP
jgi:hypothetical protein